jgi:hypothetical protein
MVPSNSTGSYDTNPIAFRKAFSLNYLMFMSSKNIDPDWGS